VSEPDEGIVLQIEDSPPCPRCGGPGLLLVRHPHSWENQRGDTVTGFKETVLCLACDRDDPAAAELLALFLVDDQLDPANLSTFAALAGAWAGSIRPRTTDVTAFNGEYERWRHGKL
jgi:hypothetical protein